MKKIGNDPLLISNVETDISPLSNQLFNTDDVSEKEDKSYETQGIVDELVVLEEIYSDVFELNMEDNTHDLENGNIDFVVTESHRKDDIRCNPVQPSSSEIRSLVIKEVNKKSVSCELERQKEKLMAWEETKSPVRGKRKYTARKERNENAILQQDKRAKVDEPTKTEYPG